MTREKIELTIEYLKNIQARYTDREYQNTRSEWYALNDAIKILEQEPKADGEYISRQAVIQHICQSKECYKENCKGNIYKRCPDTMWVYDLPSINPQEPCEDCISREWIKTAIHNFYNGLTEEDIQTYLDSAPSVKPKVEQEPKAGRWIETGNRGYADVDGNNIILYQEMCGKCKCLSYFRKSSGLLIGAKYCPNCNAKMEG